MHTLAVSANVAYAGFTLDVNEVFVLNGVTGLFGPSGGGKSTLLRVIAGLEPINQGSVKFAGEVWQDANNFLPAYRRPVGYVFQDARLFEHLTVAGNLRFAARRNRDGRIMQPEVEAALGLQTLLHRSTAALSGGERQRVAIARTLLTNPSLLLLDEPLAALDVRRKREILPYLESLPERFGIPAIYVSHSADEIARLADNVILMEDGKVAAHASVNNILSREALGESTMPFEALSILQVRVTKDATASELMQVEHNAQKLSVPTEVSLSAGETVRLLIHSGDVVLATRKPEGLSVRNVLAGVVVKVDQRAGDAFSAVTVDVHGALIKAQVTSQAVQELGLVTAQQIYVLIKTASFERGL